jgi:hypothetical protein
MEGRMDAYRNRHLLFTNAEYEAAARYWAREYMDDPTLDAPELTDDDATADADEGRRSDERLTDKWLDRVDAV